VGSIFGAIHCAAWNTNFPSTDEKWMWRACSLMVTAIPVLVAAFFVLDFTMENDMITTILGAILAAAIPSYIILPFATLHTLPPGAFADVNWSVYIPHL
ncbi:hypothetical protein DFH09DRAFT_916169, partial [Mycena vulgaris]